MSSYISRVVLSNIMAAEELDLIAYLPRLGPLACEWAEIQSRHILENGRPPDKLGIAIASFVGVRLPSRIRCLVVPSMPRPEHPELSAACDLLGFLGPTTSGLTLGYGVFLLSGHETDIGLLAHEFRHVSQYEHFGSIPSFLAMYLPDLIQSGYSQCHFERDASTAAMEFLKAAAFAMQGS